MGGGGNGGNNYDMVVRDEEQKEEYYRKDPTFHKEISKAVYSGGSIETMIYLSNG